MKFILRKYVEAATPAEAIKLDKKTPVHDVYLREGEEPKSGNPKDVIGFWHDTEVGPYIGEEVARKKR